MAESQANLYKASRRRRKRKICDISGGDFSHSAYYSHHCTRTRIDEDEMFVPPESPSRSSSSSDFKLETFKED